MIMRCSRRVSVEQRAYMLCCGSEHCLRNDANMDQKYARVLNMRQRITVPLQSATKTLACSRAAHDASDIIVWLPRTGPATNWPVGKRR
jgi:hypothetical protein